MLALHKRIYGGLSMNKEEIVKVFREIADKVESGDIVVRCKTLTYASIPFSTVDAYMEFTNRSELEFTYKPHKMAELTPTVVIHSSDIENIILTKAENDDLFGEYEIKFVSTDNLMVVATVKLKENQQFELLQLREC